jgi:hypothetical protein
MQCDRKDAKLKEASAFKQLMRGIVNGVFGIIEGVDMKIDLDPIALARFSR